MEDELAPLHGAGDGRRIAQIAHHHLRARLLEVPSRAGPPHEATHLRPVRLEPLEQVAADEARRAREKDLHPTVQPRKFQAASRSMSPGLWRAPRTTEASKPECIAQFWQSVS